MSGDVREFVYHPYLFTGCQYRETKFDEHPVYSQRHYIWEEMDAADILGDFSDPYGIHGFDDGGIRTYGNHTDGAHWPCSVIWKEEGDFYTVRIHSVDASHPPWELNGFPRLITGFPRDKIHYFVRPFEADQYLPGVFRHPIGIRDEIFPQQWKNAAVKEQSAAS